MKLNLTSRKILINFFYVLDIMMCGWMLWIFVDHCLIFTLLLFSDHF